MNDPSRVHPGPSPVRPATANDLLAEFAEFSERFRRLAPDSIRSQRVYLIFALDDITKGKPDRFFSVLAPREIMRMVSSYALSHGAGARGWMQWSVRSLLRFCHLRGYTSTDMSVWVPSLRRPRLATIPKAIPLDVIGTLLASIDPGEVNGKRDAAIIQLLATYGVRGFQIRSLRISDLDWECNRIHFLPCKGGKTVVQHLDVTAGNRLAEYLMDARPKETVHLEVFLASTPPYRPIMHASELSAIIARHLRRAGIQLPEGVSHGTHGFRHAFASRLCGKIPLKHISDMLGHRCPSTTLVYAKVDFDGLAHATLPWPEEGVQ